MYRLEMNFRRLPDTQADVVTWKQRSAERKLWHKEVYWEARQQHLIPKTPLTRVSVRGVRFSNKMPDRCNLWYSFKAIVDGLTKAGIIADDNPWILLHEDYDWMFVKDNRQFGVRLVVEELATDWQLPARCQGHNECPVCCKDTPP
ncbi:unnamed protein product [marine sediment metagenome]|uniref:Uncharacterized protein n=1 Tax=marine sediment metagenome TaxID=412755 RepID=X0ZCY5_9ZZZZ